MGREPRYRLLIFGCVTGLAIPIACGPESGEPPDAEGAAAVTGPLPTAPAARCEVLASLPKKRGDLRKYLLAARIEASGSEGFLQPSASEMGDFQSAFAQLLEAGPTADAIADFASLGFAVSRFADEKEGGDWLLIEDTRGGRGAGTFVLNAVPARDLWLETPHADSDVGTLRQGADHLVTLGARALVITGSHRCANSQVTSCDGKTVVCGGALRVSDAAHNDQTFFTAAHRALRSAYPQGLAVSLHGMEGSGSEAAVISNGTRHAQPNSLSLRLRDVLNTRLSASHRAYACNDPKEEGLYRPLCGITNVQGRIDNGSPNACSDGAPSANDRFLHIEQDPDLRAEGTGIDAVAESISELVPCALPGRGLGCVSSSSACP